MAPEEPAPRRRGYRWLQSLLLIGFSIFALISIFALVALWWFFGFTPASSSEPDLAVAVDQIRPELALMYLAGDPVDALAMQALQAGEYATSQALVTFGASAVSNPNVTL
ncbi:MAG: hypothetical protein KDE58_14875, partial [Caldilineaceae bacterium]|nr:hypothetical protein [Caldilineaceae bacterium]